VQSPGYVALGVGRVGVCGQLVPATVRPRRPRASPKPLREAAIMAVNLVAAVASRSSREAQWRVSSGFCQLVLFAMQSAAVAEHCFLHLGSYLALLVTFYRHVIKQAELL
jgi:hypothetical protein